MCWPRQPQRFARTIRLRKCIMRSFSAPIILFPSVEYAWALPLLILPSPSSRDLHPTLICKHPATRMPSPPTLQVGEQQDLRVAPIWHKITATDTAFERTRLHAQKPPPTAILKADVNRRFRCAQTPLLLFTMNWPLRRGRRAYTLLTSRHGQPCHAF